MREAFPSVATGVRLTVGLLGSDDPLQVVSEMGEGGDGIEDDRIGFGWGTAARVRIAGTRPHLVC